MDRFEVMLLVEDCLLRLEKGVDWSGKMGEVARRSRREDFVLVFGYVLLMVKVLRSVPMFIGLCGELWQ